MSASLVGSEMCIRDRRRTMLPSGTRMARTCPRKWRRSRTASRRPAFTGQTASTSAGSRSSAMTLTIPST
eukprot:3461328-Alexandrium_andersonii.AAC.1